MSFRALGDRGSATVSQPVINSRSILHSFKCNSFVARAFDSISKVRLCRLLLLLVLASLGCLSLLGQTQRAANLQVGHDVWTFKEGAPENVNTLAQTADGFLWIGTQTGLFRFDGTRFEAFHSPFGDQLLSTNVYSLFAPPSGGLWIGYTFGGFSFLNNGRVTNYGGEIASSTGSVLNFDRARDGILWAATSSGLWRFDHSIWQHVGAEWNAPLEAVGEARFDREGVLWILTGVFFKAKQLFYLSPGARKFQAAETNLHVHGFTVDPDGNVVTSPSSKRVVHNASGNSDDGPLAYPVLRKDSFQIVDRTNGIWIQPKDPVLIHSPATEPIYDAQSKASRSSTETYNINPNSTAKLVDREGNIWFGEPRGVHRFFYSPLIKQELPKSTDGLYFAVAPDDHGAVWINAFSGRESSSLYHVSSGTAELRRSTPGLPESAYSAPDKTFWFGGGDGLWHLAGGNWVQLDLPREMANQISFQTITQDRLGGLWVSFGRHGLYRFANGVWTPYGGREDLPKTGVVIEFTDSLGRVWFGYTKSTLAVLDGDRVQVFGPSDGLRVGNVTAIYGRGSEIWIGGEFGLQQFDHGRFHNINGVDDQWLRGISGIVETANGDLWLNGLGGIFHVHRSEISEALKNPAYQVKGEHFGRREGLLGVAHQLRPLPTAIEGSDGRLWFTGTNGVVWLDPTRSENNVPPPPISIQSVSADDKFYAPVSSLKFPAHTSSVQINYAAVSLSDPEAIRFRYKLQETDKDWHEMAAANPVSYRNLAPGTYHFSVADTDTNGVWSDKVATAEFTILPAFYQTQWFLALCILTAMALLYFLYLLRLKQATQRVRASMGARLAERERIARDLHDTLLQSFHGVLFHLQAASNLFASRPTEAKQILDNTIDQAAQAISEGRDAVKGLRSSTVETSDLVLALNTLGEELAGNRSKANSAEFHVVVEGTPRNLQPILWNEVFRIASEAVRNAFKHAQAQRIEVEIRYDEREFRLRVRDDGKGIAPKLLNEGGHPGHYGLRGMRERAKLMCGELKIWSALEAGTELELRIPLPVFTRPVPAVRNWLRSSLGKTRKSSHGRSPERLGS
jgi:signal transduction histidine kinase/ligand-binding sensor domain-containing protein